MKQFITFFILAFSTMSGLAQGANDLTKNEIRSLTEVLLFQGTKAYPKSYLKGYSKDSLNVYVQMMDQQTGFFFIEDHVRLMDYDRIVIRDKKKKRRNSILLSSGMGLVSFWAVQSLTRTKNEDVNTLPSFEIRQSNGVTEGIIGGTIGASLGMILSQSLFSMKFNLNSKSEAEKARKILELNNQ